MRQPRKQKDPEPVGPALRGEQVCELWVWLWSKLEERGAAGDAAGLDEARRLAVAFDRAIEQRMHCHDFRNSRFVRDQALEHGALLAHYLLVRTEQWKSAEPDPERHASAAARLRVLADATRLLESMLGVALAELAARFDELNIGLSGRSVFQPREDEGVTLETVAEGPALPDEGRRRSAEARARFQARLQVARDRPRKRRVLTEVPS